MKRMLPLALVIVTVVAPPAIALAKGGAAPPPNSVKTHNDEAAEYLSNLVSLRSGQKDAEAIASVAKLADYWRDQQITADIKAVIPGLLLWYARRHSDAVSLAGVNALAGMGKGQGSQSLARFVDGMLLQKDRSAEAMAAAFKGLQKTADPDPSVVKTLLTAVASREKEVAALAVGAIAAYDKAPPDTKRHLFEQSLSSFEGMSAAAAATDADKAVVEKWAALGAPALAELDALSHQQFADVPAARKWFTEHGREPGSWK
jgi:hypothetical protein